MEVGPHHDPHFCPVCGVCLCGCSECGKAFCFCYDCPCMLADEPSTITHGRCRYTQGGHSGTRETED